MQLKIPIEDSIESSIEDPIEDSIEDSIEDPIENSIADPHSIDLKFSSGGRSKNISEIRSLK